MVATPITAILLTIPIPYKAEYFVTRIADTARQFPIELRQHSRDIVDADCSSPVPHKAPAARRRVENRDLLPVIAHVDNVVWALPRELGYCISHALSPNRAL
jgi:hypothetical protein